MGTYYLANICMFKVTNRNTRKRREICSKPTIKHKNDVNDIVLVLLLLILNISFSSVSIGDNEQVNASWVSTKYVIIISKA